MEYINIALHLLTMSAIYAIATAGLNIQFGFAGLANFGVAGFFGTGAYISAILSLAGVPFGVASICAILGAALIGWGLASVIASLKAGHWAIATIAFGEIARLIVTNESWLTKGTFGIEGIPRPLSSYIPETVYPYAYLAMVLVILAAVVWFCTALKHSPFGRDLRLVRENEDLALSLGKSVHKLRALTLAVGCGLMGLSGSLYASYVTFISPDDMTLVLTLLVWTMLIVGGKGNITGSIIGVVLIVALYNSTRYLKDYLPIDGDVLGALRLVAIGLLLIVMMIRRPAGLLPETRRAF